MTHLQLPSTPCQLANVKSKLDASNEILRLLSTLGEVTDETYPCAQRCILQQKKFDLIESDEMGKYWDITCTLTLCNFRGEVITRDTGLVPAVKFNKITPNALQRLRKAESARLEDMSMSSEETSLKDTDILDHKLSFENGVWTLRIKCSLLSGLTVSISLNGKEVAESPMTIRRGKPDLFFGENMGDILSTSDFYTGFLSSMTAENIRCIDGTPVIWNRDRTLKKGSFNSFISMKMSASRCLISHIVLKSSMSLHYKLYYRKSRSSRECNEAIVTTDDNEGAEGGDDWTLFQFLTPDWIALKENRLLVVDVKEDQCKNIGFIEAIRLELQSSPEVDKISFNGINVYGWNID